MRVPGFDLPTSTFLDAEARAALTQQAELHQTVAELCPYEYSDLHDRGKVIALRNGYDEYLHKPLVSRHRSLYDVAIEQREIAGVATEQFIPAEHHSSRHARCVLVNLHGGGFVIGGRWVGQIESVPIARTAGIKVVSVDYRMAPEHRFPAATEDVVKVYRELLNDHKPESIGIFGCSAGALLTAQTVAWLEKVSLPRPGAVAMLFGGGSYFGEGDAGHTYSARASLPLDQVVDSRTNPYFKNTDPDDPLAFPVRSQEVIARFPPALLASATRDLAMSSVVHTHARLVEAGVSAQLHVWEGLEHAFHYWPGLPQSRAAYSIVARFFETHLRP